LDEEYGTARISGNVRWLKAQIIDESVEPKGKRALGEFTTDFNAAREEMQPKSPCYILFRLDTQNMNGYEWIVLAYVPEGSTVRDRMLYASTRDALKRGLGLSYFVEDLFGSNKEDFTIENLQAHLTKKRVEGPLTKAEVQTRNERIAEVDLGTSREYVHSVQFPMSQQAQAKLQALRDGSINLVQLKVDPQKETIELDSAKSVDLQGLQSSIPTNEPRFSIYRYSHEFEGEHFDSNLFIYSCTNDSPIKLKMLYSTVKAVANGAAEANGLKLDKKLEISEGSELTVELFNETLHPPAEEKKQAFSKPVRAGKGKPRLIKK